MRTTIAAAVVYAVIARLLGDALAFGGGQIVALAVVIVLSSRWTPAIRRGPPEIFTRHRSQIGRQA